MSLDGALMSLFQNWIMSRWLLLLSPFIISIRLPSMRAPSIRARIIESIEALLKLLPMSLRLSTSRICAPVLKFTISVFSTRKSDDSFTQSPYPEPYPPASMPSISELTMLMPLVPLKKNGLLVSLLAL